jgi:hypothetical protein
MAGNYIYLPLEKHFYHVRTEVFTVVTMQNAVFWGVIPCSDKFL